MAYYDCYLIPVPAENLEAYKAFSAGIAKVYVEYGARSVVDTILDPETGDGSEFHADGAQDEIGTDALRSFPVAAAAALGEVVVLSWTEWPDRQTRDRQLPLVLADARVQPDEDQEVIFEGRRLIAGGFHLLARTP